MTDNPNPLLCMVTNRDGSPSGVVDLDQLQDDSVKLMYEICAAAGDDAAVESVTTKWTEKADEQYLGFVAASALVLAANNVLGPLLELIEALHPELRIRDKLAELRDSTGQVIGGGQ